MRKLYHTPEEKREAQHAYDRKRQQTEHRRAYDRQRHNTDEHNAKRRERAAIKREARKLNPPVPKTAKQASLLKICPQCDPPTEKFLSEFAVDKSRKDGRAGWCKECMRRWTNSEEEKTRQREYRKIQRRNNPEAAQRRRESLNKWRREHPESQQELTMRRNARKKAATTERVSYKQVLTQWGYHCYICERDIDPNAKKKSPESLTFDHVIPLQPYPGNPQGTHSESNLRPSHRVCNGRKGQKPFDTLTPFDRSGP